MAYIIGKGTLLKVTISSTLTTVPQAKSITPPPLEMGSVETTHLTSAMREYMATIINPGEASFELEYDPANSVHAQLYTYALAGTSVAWTVTLPDAGTCVIAFTGFIKTFGVGELSVETVTTIPVKIQVTGAVTYTP